MAVLDALMKEAIKRASPHMREIGFELVSLGGGLAVGRLPYREDLVGDPDSGVLHGGVVTTVLDSTAGAAVVSALRVPGPIATLDLRIDYLRGSTPGQTLEARVECYKVAREVAFVRGIAHNGDPERPVASMAGTFMLRTTAVRLPGGGGS